jgi:hypothetical protein
MRCAWTHGDAAAVCCLGHALSGWCAHVAAEPLSALPCRMISAGSIVAYIKVPWNAFDCVMVAAGYTQFIPMGDGEGGTGGIRALRALRALRPLRTITRFDSLRSVVVCFLEVSKWCWASAACWAMHRRCTSACAGPTLYHARLAVPDRTAQALLRAGFSETV